MRLILKALLCLLLNAALLIFLSNHWGDIPPLGHLLNPFDGLWKRPTQLRLKNELVIAPALKAPAQVIWDKEKVPHIQAESAADLYWVQGYLHASQRLFQMDVQTRGGGGELSELLGIRTKVMDEMLVAVGLREASRKINKRMLEDAELKEILEAYVAGVNFWITQATQNLNNLSLPTEYQLLGVNPELWDTTRVARLLAVMGFRLSGRSYDLQLTKFRRKYTAPQLEEIFPARLPPEYEAPFVFTENSRKGLKLKMSRFANDDKFISKIHSLPKILKPFSGNGSNSWAVGPSRSETGFSIVANDTHLGFSLPNMWFEVQLQSSELNVYGGSFAGAPGILSGFNQKVAWAVTNGTTDVIDWYEFDLDGKGEDTKYKSVTGWQPVQVIKEKIKIRGAADFEIEQLWTHLGPIVHREGDRGLVMRWTLQDAGRELKTFINLNRAKDFAECEQALQGYGTPIQNFICADEKNVGIFHRGFVPKRQVEGRYILDGTKEYNQWQGFYAENELPYNIRPQKGYVFSANQNPVGENFPYFLGTDYEDAFRGLRIREFLEGENKWSAAGFIEMQTNTLDTLARVVVPIFLKVLSEKSRLANGDILELLSKWDYHNNFTSIPSTVFAEWWRQLKRAVWQDQLGPREEGVWPRDQFLEHLVVRASQSSESYNFWLDDEQTGVKENLSDIINRAFEGAIEELKKQLGNDWRKWQWSKYQILQFPHLARLPAFARTLPGQGSRSSLVAIQKVHGPTWRYVAALGPGFAAWSSVPSGAAGDPLATDYENGLANWVQGKYKKVHFFHEGISNEANELNEVFARWRFKHE